MQIHPVPVHLIQHTPTIDLKLQPVKTIFMFKISSCALDQPNFQYLYQRLEFSIQPSGSIDSCGLQNLTITSEKAELLFLSTFNQQHLDSIGLTNGQFVHNVYPLSDSLIIDLVLLQFSAQNRLIIDITITDVGCNLIITPLITGEICHTLHAVDSNSMIKINNVHNYPPKMIEPPKQTLQQPCTQEDFSNRTNNGFIAWVTALIRSAVRQIIICAFVALVTVYVVLRSTQQGVDTEQFHIDYEYAFERYIREAQLEVANRLRVAFRRNNRY